MKDIAAVLFSLKPIYAYAILDGTKRMELRRTVPSLLPGDPCLMYATAPVRRVVGMFIAGNMTVATTIPEQRALRTAARHAGVTGDDFDAYTSGARVVAGIDVLNALACEPFVLPFHPPRSFTILRSDDPKAAGLPYVARYLADRAAKVR